MLTSPLCTYFVTGLAEAALGEEAHAADHRLLHRCGNGFPGALADLVEERVVESGAMTALPVARVHGDVDPVLRRHERPTHVIHQAESDDAPAILGDDP